MQNRGNLATYFSVEEIIQLLEQVESNLKARNYDKIVVASVVKLNVAMKSYGSQVELFHRELLDRAQVALRNACKDTSLDIVARLHLLEIIELRSMKWVLNESVLNYYRQKLSQIDVSFTYFSKLEFFRIFLMNFFRIFLRI